MVQDGSDYLYFTREGDSVIKLRTQDTITVSGDTSFGLTNSTIVVEVGNTSNTGALSTIKPGASGLSTKLSIKNLSNSDLFNVRWVGMTLPYNRISMGDTVQQEVSVGSAYIFFEFKRKSASVSARTRDMVTVTEEEPVEFTFTDTTVIVETETNKTGTLKERIAAATALSIKNQSFSDLLNVRWQSVTFESVPTGTTTEQKSATVASGYIYFDRKSNPISARTKDMVTVTEETLTEFTFTDTTEIVETDHPDNMGTLKDLLAATTSLSIRNQSFSDLLNVQWEGISFTASTMEDSISIGKTVKQEVSAGSAYIYFKRKTNPAVARTKDPVVITEGKLTEFTFTDDTEIVEANNPNNSGTLNGMTTTVLFFDDAEGEIQNYAERKNSDYYAKPEDLPNYSSYSYSFYYSAPYKDTGKSIALGGAADCKLRLSITLARSGKLSFRFAHKSYGTDVREIGTISIDGTEKTSWQGNYNWSYLEYSLEPGTHEIVWTKNGAVYSSSRSYLSLDDILVVLDTE
jgi:hypothetical protein